MLGNRIHWIARNIVVTILVGIALFATRNASAAQLTLDWVDNAGGTASFTIERKTDITGTYTRIATTPTGTTTYVDTAVVAGTTYCYRVKASNGSQDSGFSNDACASPIAGVDFTVAKAGTGGGTVVSSPPGITCGGNCAASYPAGKVITLTATADSGSSFSGWSGSGCSGTAPCVLVGNTPVSVTASFALTGAAQLAAGAVTLVVTGNPATGAYAVEAQTTLTGALAVNFFVDGTFFRQETVAKYCLFGGDAACATGTLGEGAHVIKAQVLAQGTTRVLAETQIGVPARPVALVVWGNPAAGAYAIEAQTTLTGELTVNFFVDGSFFHQETTAKYCLFGGDAACGTGMLGAGAHVIKVQVFPQDGSPVAETQITVTE